MAGNEPVYYWDTCLFLAWIKDEERKSGDWLMTPRPSMPPGHVIARGEKPGGGKMDFCWLVWDRSYHQGAPELRWLRRDGDAA